MEHPVLETIRNRRSVRRYTDEPVTSEELDAILEAGRWAPSGLNNQPWRFVVVETAETKAGLAECTHYGRIVTSAPVLIAVFMDRSACYDALKDAQAVGACLQNMLLAVHALGLGAVWLGEILKNAEKVRDLFGLGPDLDLQAVLAVGRPADGAGEGSRRPLTEMILKRC